MEKFKKVFGGLNLTWAKVIIFAIIAGIYTAVMAMLPIVKDTSFSDLTVTFEVWILCGIFIIMNSKSAIDSALKCFVFFLISQPLIYIIQDVVNKSNLFVTYYRYWFMWTIATIPMGFVGYFMKKDKWWGLLILTPISVLLGLEYSTYLGETIFSFPFHLLTTLFCIVTLMIYPLVIFSNKKIKIVGVIISTFIIVVMTIFTIIRPPVYSTEILISGEEHQFDNTYKVYLLDSKYGNLSIKYEEALETWMLHADFKHAGTTEFILESPNGEKMVFNIIIKKFTYEIKKK